MKNKLLCTCVTIAILTLIGCTTIPKELARGGYNKGKEQDVLRFLGVSHHIPWDEEKNNEIPTTVTRNAATRDAMVQISTYIKVQIIRELIDREGEFSQSSQTVLSKKVLNRRRTGQYLRPYSLATSEYKVLEKKITGTSQTVSEVIEKSSGYFQGAKQLYEVSQTIKRTVWYIKWLIPKRTITATKYWIVYEISMEDIEKARKGIESNSGEKELEEYTRTIEEDAFENWSKQYENLKKKLSQSNIDDASISELYSELLDINSRLGNLSILSKDHRIKEIMDQISKDIEIYDPANRILYLTLQISERERQIAALEVDKDKQIAALKADKDIQIAALEAEIRTLREDRRSSTFTILSTPQRPQETLVTSGDFRILATTDNVLAVDFISFASVSNMNRSPMADRALYSPAVSVSWNDAARYCNYLSRMFGYIPAYIERNGRIIRYDKQNNGFRLPEEAEIEAMVDAGIINESLYPMGIWSSTGYPSMFVSYRLSDEGLEINNTNTGTANSEIGFRVVRNAE